MGVEVVDERPYQITAADGRLSWVYDFGLRYDPSGEVGPDSVKELFQAAFEAVWSGAAESDGFNALVLRAGLSWRQAMVLRAYAKYLRQAGSTFSQEYIEQALLSNVPIARLLVRLFEARLHPAYATARDDVMDGMLEELNGALEGVASLDQDRILRSFLTLDPGDAAHQLLPGRRRRQAKPTSRSSSTRTHPELPQPRPKFEIWVYSPRSRRAPALRLGRSRGGLRWSDRREDFRTEVLGLVKAQSVKNAVIVPVGGEGRLRRQAAAGADGRRDEGPRRVLRRGRRRATRRSSAGCSTSPTTSCRATSCRLTRSVRHDDDDAYSSSRLTRHRDVLRHRQRRRQGLRLLARRRLRLGWLRRLRPQGDGHHARGAWESVKRHFREMGVDTQADDVTVVASAT
jgi:glutamate dehydrogenase